VKIIKSDIVVAVILFGTWLFYLAYDGSTRFDINQTITLPLLLAADFTALAALYAAGRYYTAKKGTSIKESMHKLMDEHQAGQAQDTDEPENNKS
jgi:nitric oxide reductase large subunit